MSKFESLRPVGATVSPLELKVGDAVSSRVLGHFHSNFYSSPLLV